MAGTSRQGGKSDPGILLRLAQERLACLEQTVAAQQRELQAVREELARAHSPLERRAEVMAVSVVVADREGRIRRANPATTALLGYSEAELRGQPFAQICPQGVLSERAGPEQGSLAAGETQYRTRRGELVPVLFSCLELGGEAGFVCLAHDLARRKALEGQILQAEKLASIGQLAAGVAHEINNPMGFVYSNLSTLKDYMGDIAALLGLYRQFEMQVEAGSLQEARQSQRQLAAHRQRLELDFLLTDIDQLIAESREGVERVTRIVQSLREFARLDRDEQAPADLNQCIAGSLNVAHLELKYRARIEEHYGLIPQIVCNPRELSQVFINLLVNAAQAIGENGVITLRTYQERGWVCAEVADNGEGMSAEVRNRIFEPFFTTKPPGTGTGLGLSTCFNIVVHKHRGQLLVESTLGAGTTVTVKLPS